MKSALQIISWNPAPNLSGQPRRKYPAMDRRSACQTQASLCRARAAADAAHRTMWLAEAAIWEARALEVAVLMITIDRNPLAQTPAAKIV